MKIFNIMSKRTENILTMIGGTLITIICAGMTISAFGTPLFVVGLFLTLCGIIGIALSILGIVKEKAAKKNTKVTALETKTEQKTEDIV